MWGVKMKLFYGIILVLMIFVSACAQQPAEPAPVTEPEPSVEPEGTGDAVAEPEEVAEVTSTEIRSVGAGGFDPSELTISAGSAVTWINDDEKAAYLIIFKDGKAYTNSNRILPGEKFEHEFTEAGEYEYWQNIAYGVVGGKITVE
jgi:plastocyanin|tara:strand:+ start:5020 stop:5457 length:438 start_codon:yes stop_codon:yes gene_type:complete